MESNSNVVSNVNYLNISKPPPIFMKMSDNFNNLIISLEKQLNCILKKRVNGHLLQIHPSHSEQGLSITKFFASQPKNVRPKKILLKGIPKIYPISDVKNALMHPSNLVDILLIGNNMDLYKLNNSFGCIIKSVPYKSRGPKQCYNCQAFLILSTTAVLNLNAINVLVTIITPSVQYLKMIKEKLNALIVVKTM